MGGLKVCHGFNILGLRAKKLFTHVKNEFSNNPVLRRAYIRACATLYISMLLFNYKGISNVINPFEFVLIQFSVILVPIQKTGLHLEYLMFSMSGVIFAIIFCYLCILLTNLIPENYETTKAVLFCLTTTFVIFFATSLSYSKPKTRIFYVTASISSITLASITYNSPDMYNYIFLRYILAVLIPTVVSLIVSFTFLPNSCNSSISEGLEASINEAKNSLKHLVPLIMSFTDQNFSKEIASKLDEAKLSTKKSEDKLLLMHKSIVDSKYEFYRWHYSLWTYSEIRERTQVLLRHISGLVLSVEALYNIVSRDNEKKNALCGTSSNVHQNHNRIFNVDRPNSFSLIINLIWLMIEAIEYSMVLILHPELNTNFLNDPNKNKFNAIDVRLHKSIHTCDQMRDEIICALIEIFSKHAVPDTSDPDLKKIKKKLITNIASNFPDTKGPNIPPIKEDDVLCLTNNKKNGFSKECIDTPNLVIFFFYFSIRQSARACQEGLRSANNLFLYHLHQKRHTFWPTFYLEILPSHFMFPRKRLNFPKIRRKGILTLPSDIIYFIRLTSSRNDIRFGIKCALIMLLCYVWAFVKQTRTLYYEFRAQWAVISSIVVLNPTTGNTSSRVGHRMMGTLLGASFAILVTAMPGNNNIFFISGFVILSLITTYFNVFTRYAYTARVVLLGFLVVAFESKNINNGYKIESNKFISRIASKEIDIVLILAATRSLTVLLGTFISLLGSYIIFPTFSRIRLRLTIARVIKSAASLLTERIAHHLLWVREYSANINEEATECVDSLSPLCNDGINNRAKHLGAVEAHKISHSVYKDKRKERKAKINNSLFAISALIDMSMVDIKFASEEPDLDRPFNYKIYLKIIKRCTSIVNLLSLIEGALESQVLEELDPTSLMLILWNSHYNGIASLTATMNIISYSLSTPQIQPLPACLPLAVARQDLNMVKAHLMNIIYSQNDENNSKNSSDKIDNSPKDKNPLIQNLQFWDKKRYRVPTEHRLSFFQTRRNEDSRRHSLINVLNHGYSVSEYNACFMDHTPTITDPTLKSKLSNTMKHRTNLLNLEKSSIALRDIIDLKKIDRLGGVSSYTDILWNNYRKTPIKNNQLFIKGNRDTFDRDPLNVKTTFPTLPGRSPLDENNYPNQITGDLCQTEQNASPSISLVDIYIYAYYYAVQCLIDEVENLENEVEELIGRDVSFIVQSEEAVYSDYV